MQLAAPGVWLLMALSATRAAIGNNSKVVVVTSLRHCSCVVRVRLPCSTPVSVRTAMTSRSQARRSACCNLPRRRQFCKLLRVYRVRACTWRFKFNAAVGELLEARWVRVGAARAPRAHCPPPPRALSAPRWGVAGSTLWIDLRTAAMALRPVVRLTRESLDRRHVRARARSGAGAGDAGHRAPSYGARQWGGAVHHTAPLPH